MARRPALCMPMPMPPPAPPPPPPPPVAAASVHTAGSSANAVMSEKATSMPNTASQPKRADTHAVTNPCRMEPSEPQPLTMPVTVPTMALPYGERCPTS